MTIASTRVRVQMHERKIHQPNHALLRRCVPLSQLLIDEGLEDPSQGLGGLDIGEAGEQKVHGVEGAGVDPDVVGDGGGGGGAGGAGAGSERRVVVVGREVGEGVVAAVEEV